MSYHSSSPYDSDTDPEMLVNNRFLLYNKIGSGSFGDIFKGQDQSTGQLVAIKIEPRSAKHPQLAHEARIYDELKDCDGFPRIIWSGHDGGFNFLAMELLGPNLEQLLNQCGRRLSLKTVLMIAETILRRLESIHQLGFVHRDVKPENFLMDKKNRTKLFVIDLGLSKRYMNSVSGEHIMYRDGKSLTGTARYASINAHMGIELSRRDDLEGLMVMLIYLLRGSLPWQGQHGVTKKEKYNNILDVKLSVSVSELCKDLPKEFCQIMHYVRSLRFDECPDYRFLRRMFMELFRRKKFSMDGQYDWTGTSEGEKIDRINYSGVQMRSAGNFLKRRHKINK